MGVENLNSIIRTLEPSNVNTFSRIIIDGSNLIIHRLSHFLASLKKDFPLTIWNSINANILFQTQFIIEHVINDIHEYIMSLKQSYSVIDVYIVFDPKKTPEYMISGDMLDITTTYQKLSKSPYITRFMSQEELDNNLTVSYNIKSDEQESRKKYQNKQSIIDSRLAEFDLLHNSYQKLTDEQIDTLKQIFMQSYYYCIPSDLFKLSSTVIAGLIPKFKNKNVYIINAKQEADLVIKNIAIRNRTPEIENILVLSADSDYFVLFADTCLLYTSDAADE